MNRISILLIVLFTVASCQTEKRLLWNYIESGERPEIIILKADQVFKRNYTYSSDETEAADSIAIAYSEFIKYVDDEIFIDKYMTYLKDQFERLGYKVYDENQLGEFLSSPAEGYMLNCAQMLLEERQIPFEATDEDDIRVYVQEFILKQVELHTWFELSPKNGADKLRLLYTSHRVTDKVNGKFKKDMVTGDVKFNYDITHVDIGYVYELATYSSQETAKRLFNRFMNEWLQSKLDSLDRKADQWRYVPEKDKLYKGFEDFQELNDQL